MERNLERLADNLRRVEERVAAACQRAGRERDKVLLLAVTKKRPLEELVELHRLGLRSFGENRPQEVRDRVPALALPIDWHFIGAIQSKNAKYLVGNVAWIHSVEDMKVAEAVEKAWNREPKLPPVKTLLQFNIAGEEQKHGAGTTEAVDFLKKAIALERLDVCGLMTMAPYSDNAEDSRPVFRALRKLRDDLVAETGHPLPHLSMGMTGDFEVAIEEGATIVRVGTALFE
ncbi:MAG: YggS family pyridoxal phosphate-dependent enzyme [Candidatus Sumerlaeia bacterium]|nr:YggS family pyridoxal phosphate-dependent enzyme [Candidatus Sumerlaeia bacterium]